MSCQEMKIRKIQLFHLSFWIEICLEKILLKSVFYFIIMHIQFAKSYVYEHCSFLVVWRTFGFLQTKLQATVAQCGSGKRIPYAVACSLPLSPFFRNIKKENARSTHGFPLVTFSRSKKQWRKNLKWTCTVDVHQYPLCVV